MKRMLLLSLVVAAGCAASPKSEVRSGGSLLCGIGEPAWPSAERDFDRRATLEVLAGLADAARADRAGLHAGTRGEVGAHLDALTERTPSRAFISRGAAELGVRLRQLDCAVKGGGLAFAAADQRYAEILAELAVEESTLEPAGAAATRTAAP